MTDPPPGVFESLAKLFATLERTKHDFNAAILQASLTADAKDQDATELHYQLLRDASQYSLLAVIQFMRSLPGWEGANFALIKLLEALSETDKGRLPAWLNHGRTGRHTDGDRVLGTRARLAGVVHYLMVRGKKPDDASKTVYKRIDLPKSDPLWGTNQPSWKTVRRWKSDCTATKGKGDKDTFAIMPNLFAILEENRAGPPHVIAETMIARILEQYR
jgi:hypothetical protein